MDVRKFPTISAFLLALVDVDRRIPDLRTGYTVWRLSMLSLQTVLVVERVERGWVESGKYYVKALVTCMTLCMTLMVNCRTVFTPTIDCTYMIVRRIHTTTYAVILMTLDMTLGITPRFCRHSIT